MEKKKNEHLYPSSEIAKVGFRETLRQLDSFLGFDYVI